MFRHQIAWQIVRASIEDENVSFPEALKRLRDKYTWNREQSNIYLKYAQRLIDSYDREEIEQYILHQIGLLTQEKIGFNTDLLFEDLDNWGEDTRDRWAKIYFENPSFKETFQDWQDRFRKMKSELKLENADIAAMLGKPVTSVKSQTSKGMDRDFPTWGKAMILTYEMLTKKASS